MQLEEQRAQCNIWTDSKRTKVSLKQKEKPSIYNGQIWQDQLNGVYYKFVQPNLHWAK